MGRNDVATYFRDINFSKEKKRIDKQVSVLGEYRGSHIASPFSFLASGP